MAKPVEGNTPSLQAGKPLIAAGLRASYSAATVSHIPALWQRMAPHFGKLRARIGGSAYGLVMNMRAPDSFDYLAGVEVAGSAGLPRALTSVSIPAQRYAVFIHPGHVSRLKDTMNAIWHQWSPSWRRAGAT